MKTTDCPLLKVISEIAATPLWGGAITNEAFKAELIETDQYDTETDSYNPCIDTESSALTYIVELGREALAAARAP